MSFGQPSDLLGETKSKFIRPTEASLEEAISYFPKKPFLSFWGMYHKTFYGRNKFCNVET